jgi:hypothetical protein
MSAFAAATGVQVGLMSRAMFLLQAPLAAVRAGFVALTAAMLANPITFIITAVTSLIALLYAFGDAVKLNADGSINAWGAFAGTVQYLWDLLKQLGGWISETFGPYWKIFKEIAMDVLTTIAKGIQWIIDKLSLLIPSLSGVSAKMSEMGKSWTDAMKAASAASEKGGLSNVNLGNSFKKAGDEANGASFSVDKNSKSLTVNAGEQERLKKLVDAGKTAFEKNKQALDATIKSTDDLSVTTRDAMGKIVTYANAAEAQTASLFTNMKDGAATATDAMDALAESTRAAGEAIQSTSTISAAFNSKGDVKQAFKSQGGTDAQADALQRALQTFDVVVGTPAGGPALQKLYNLLSQIPPDAAKSFVGNYPYINSYLQGQGLPTFANGGSFNVGGSGGTDSQLVQFMASPNETVTIQTPQQRQAGNGGGSRNVIVNMEVKTPDANSFRRSQNQTLMQLAGKINNAVG